MRSKNKELIINIMFCLLSLDFFIDGIKDSDYIKVLISSCLFGFGISMLLVSRYKWRFKTIFPALTIFIVIIVFTVAVPFIIHKYYYAEKEVSEQLVLTLYGSYITFLGTSTLGYVVYLTDKIRRNESKYSSCVKLNLMLNNMNYDIRYVMQNKIKANKIEYDENWMSYFLDFSHLYNSDYTELIKKKLVQIMDIVHLMNIYLQDNQTQKAIELYSSFIKEEQYSIFPYNYFEFERIIGLAAQGITDEKDLIPWYENKRTKKMIDKYAEKYQFLIDNCIYNYMLKNHKDNIKLKKINNDVVDWLSTNDTIKKDIISPYDKRILSAVIFNTCKKFTRLQFVEWELSIK